VIEWGPTWIEMSWPAWEVDHPVTTAGETHFFGKMPLQGFVLWHGYSAWLRCYLLVTMDEDGMVYRAVTDRTHGNTWAYGTTEHEALRALIQKVESIYG
jgi:hypothetical protein